MYRKPESSTDRDVAGTPGGSLNATPAPEYSIKPPRKSQRRHPRQADQTNAAIPSDPPTMGPQLDETSNQRQILSYPHRQHQPQSRIPNRSQHAQEVFHGQPRNSVGVPRQWTHTTMPQNPVYCRPPPQHPQLFDPHQHMSHTHQLPRMNRVAPTTYAASQAAAQAQITYLDTIAAEEVPKAMISPDEEREKELMRKILEDVCQRVITEHEIEKDALFDGSTVCLKCYGSLRTGFATQSSDMDLVLQSPSSKPHVSSTESDIPRLLEKALLDLGFGARLLTRTRLPLIKFCEKPTPELAGRLCQERLKWEKERDAPPKTDEKAKDSSSKKTKNNGTRQVGLPDGQKPYNDQVNLKDEAEEIGVLGSPIASNIQVKSLNKADEIGLLGNLVASSLHVNSLDNADNVASSRLQLGMTRQEKPDAPAVVKERREVVLPDDELVELYRLAIKEGWFEPEERKTILAFMKAVEGGGPNNQVAECRAQLLSLPDVLNRYRPPPDHLLDFPKDGVGVQCDIIFSNPLAIQNSAMLRCYNLSDARVKPMVLFIKAWATRRKINSPYHGTLSSYGYVLMVLHYLVNLARPPICLNMQNVEMARRGTSIESTQVIEGHNVSFWRNEEVIQQWARQGYITTDRDSTVGSLLRGFFQYFATPSGGFSWATEVLSLRTPGGILTKKQKGWIAAKTEVLDPVKEGTKGQEVRQRYLFAIEDPFETNHNVARTVVHNGIVAIRDEFRRANRLIHQAANGQPIEDLFVEAESKDDLHYRHFGPRPRPPNPKATSPATHPNVEQNRKDAPSQPKSKTTRHTAEQPLLASANDAEPIPRPPVEAT